MTMPLPARIVQSSLLAAGCGIAAVQVLRVDRPRLGWLPAALGILAVAAMVHAFGGVWPRSLLVALGLQTLAGAVALASAVIELRSALVGTRDGMTSMLQDLGAMRDENSRRRAEESERLHEVRSVLAGLYAARDTLRKYEDTLESADRRRLQDAVGEELGRLNQLIDPVLRADIEDLRLADVLASVVLAEREQGLVVTTDLAEVRVRGRAAEIATLVSDLLVNARVHAPGSAVRLTARLDAGMVALDVRNWGPELSASEGERVFERTYRGARSVADGVPGSGLGLYTARKLALQMNGDVQHLTPVGGGCCFVVTLPVAKADAGVAPSLQGATQNRGAVDPHPVPQHVAASRAPEPHIATPHRSLPIAVDGTQRWPERVGNKLVSGGQRTLQRYGQTR